MLPRVLVHQQDHISLSRQQRASMVVLRPDAPSYIYYRSYIVCQALSLPPFRRNNAIFIWKVPTDSTIWSLSMARGTFVAGTKYFVANATILKPITHPIDSSYLHFFQFHLPTSTSSTSIFLRPPLPIPSSYLRILNSLFRCHHFSCLRSTLVCLFYYCLFCFVPCFINSNCYNDHCILQIITEIIY